MYDSENITTEQTPEEVQRIAKAKRQRETAEREQAQIRKKQYYATLPLEIAQAKVNEFIEMHAPAEYHEIKRETDEARDSFNSGLYTIAELHQIARKLDKCDNLTTRETLILQKELVEEKKRQQSQMLII